MLDFQAGLDAALARAGLEPAYRRAAVKDAGRVVEAMAFRFALMDERPLPEDLDHLRALGAVKPPERVAPVLLARRPVYARARRQRLLATWSVLLALALAVGGLAYVATSEESVPLAEFSATRSTNRTFVVTESFTRLHIDGTVLHPEDALAAISIFLAGPDGQAIQVWPSGDARNNYVRLNLAPPQLTPGEWRVFVDFNQGGGSVHLTILGVQSTR